MDECAFAEPASRPKSQPLDSQGKQRLDNEDKMSNNLLVDSHESGYESTGAAKKGSPAPEAWSQNEDTEVLEFIDPEFFGVASPHFVKPDLEHTNIGRYLTVSSRDSGYGSLETSPKIMGSLEDDGQSIEIINRMKRGNSNRDIAEWLFVGSDTQTLPLTTEHQTSAVVGACSQADSRDEQELDYALILLQRGTQLDENTGTPTMVGYTNVRILSVSSHS